MMTRPSLILKSKSELRENLKGVSNFLDRASRLSFWHTHFANQGFRFEPGKFDWNYWTNIPFVTKEDFLNLGLNRRLNDANKITKSEPLHFILQSTSGTSRTTRPILFLKNVDHLVDGKSHNKGRRILILYQGRAISLRDVFATIRQRKQKSTISQSLVVNPFQFTGNMIEAISEFNADSTVTFPASVAYLTSSFPENRKIFTPMKHVYLSGDFMSRQQALLTQTKFKKANIDIDYIMTEVDSIGICCKFLRARYGTNAYHPFNGRIIELVDIDENGVGEVVVTKTYPLELSFIRYKTGDVARAINKTCSCKAQWTIFLEGRKNMDYIKSLGVLITRSEITRALKAFDKEIEEWRAEVREIPFKGALLGELTLLIKPHNRLADKDFLKKLKEDVGTKLLLTPQKTLAMLASEKKFMPLKIQVIKEFPPASKKVLLRKVLD
ncbi:hypothetical protein HYT17_01605 [Candidatus Microgenomates bacterium]|nr:hypothetical protein [Candidatus Microgenomates bacterium]